MRGALGFSVLARKIGFSVFVPKDHGFIGFTVFIAVCRFFRFLASGFRFS